MNCEDKKLQTQREHMVSHHLQARGIRDPRVLQAFRTVPRECFLPDSLRNRAYDDRPIPIGQGQTISQPYIVALSLQELQVQSGQKVLDVGAGSGYQAALLATMGAAVFAIERISALAEQAKQNLRHAGVQGISWRIGDGTLGWPQRAPFDRIVCGAAGPRVPQAWIDQLAEYGRIVTPVGEKMGIQSLQVLEKHGPELLRRDITGVRFVPLLGEQGFSEAD